MDINTLKNRLFSELASTGKPITVFSEGNVLKINVGGAVTDVFNWHLMTIDDIVRNVKTSVIKESHQGRVLLNEVRYH